MTKQYSRANHPWKNRKVIGTKERQKMWAKAAKQKRERMAAMVNPGGLSLGIWGDDNNTEVESD